jgi:hypothetical protein
MIDTTVRTRDLSWEQLVRQREQEDYLKPDVVYEFSNGRKFQSTDHTDSGIYER